MVSDIFSCLYQARLLPGIPNELRWQGSVPHWSRIRNSVKNSYGERLLDVRFGHITYPHGVNSVNQVRLCLKYLMNYVGIVYPTLIQHKNFENDQWRMGACFIRGIWFSLDKSVIKWNWVWQSRYTVFSAGRRCPKIDDHSRCHILPDWTLEKRSLSNFPS